MSAPEYLERDHENFNGRLPFALALFVGAPWWFVSLLLHTLALVIFSLLTPAVPVQELECHVVADADLRGDTDRPEREVSKPDIAGIVSSGVKVPGDGRDVSDIQVPPDILAKAELGDHFETITPDHVDVRSSFGDPDSHFFHSVAGDESKTGGGGMVGADGMADDAVGPGMIYSRGSGGGWGGGDGDGTGVDDGSGHGTFGSRNGGGRSLIVKRGSHATEKYTHPAFDWLAHHQEADGHWDTVKNGAKHRTDTAVTALALLAFLCEGHSERVGGYKDNVKRAVAWLRAQQHSDGSIYSEKDAPEFAGTGYPMAMATLALCEASGMNGNRIPETKDAAQRAVDCLTGFQHSDADGPLGFRYHPHEAGDLSVTGWVAMALKSAKVAGLKVNSGAFEGIVRFVDSVEIKGSASESFTPPSHFMYRKDDPHSASAHRLAAIGVMTRYLCGYPRQDMESSVDWMIEKGGLPAWGEHGEKVDLYYWYFGSLCVLQNGGESYRTWRKQLQAELIAHQIHDGDEAGSWPVVGDFSQEWGRVGQCALSCLCLSIQDRYHTIRSN